jgi:carbon monoxide dehydrogenase subunit G
MITVEQDIHINAPIDYVFDFISDPANNASWQSGLIRSEMTSDGPIDVGSTFVYVQKFMGREMNNETVVSVWDPPNSQGFKTTSGPVDFEAVTSLQEMGGGTHLTTRIEGEAGGFFKVAEGMVAKQLESTIGNDLASLKALLEG